MAGTGSEGEQGGLTPREAAERVEPGRKRPEDDGRSDPREEQGLDQPESSAQKRPPLPER
jgi:hypothetical protein